MPYDACGAVAEAGGYALRQTGGTWHRPDGEAMPWIRYEIYDGYDKLDMWYVIWTEARSEYQLKSRIEKDIDNSLYSRCWVPTKTEQRKLDGKYTEVERILFPGYIFIDTEDPEKLHIEIRKTKYNSRVMKTGEDFTPISMTEEEIIRHLTGNDGRMGISTGIIENGNLKVIDGPLKGFEKYIVRIDRHKRKAWLKIKLFGEERKFNAGLCVIEKH